MIARSAFLENINRELKQSSVLCAVLEAFKLASEVLSAFSVQLERISLQWEAEILLKVV